MNKGLAHRSACVGFFLLSGCSSNPINSAATTSDGGSGAGAGVANSTGTAGSAPAMGPVAVASGQDEPAGVAVDDTSVYWTVFYGNTVMKAPVGGGTAVELASANTPDGIAIDGTRAYWTASDGSVQAVPLAGGSPVTLSAGVGGTYAYELAVDGSNAYWSTGSVAKTVPLSGTAFASTIGTGSGLMGIAVDANYVYWTNRDGGTVVQRAKTVSAAGITVTLAATTLASGQGGPWAITVDSTNVYWTNRDAGTIMSKPLAGGAPVIIASGQDDPDAIAVDSTTVYWANLKGGTLMKAPLAGGTPTMLASEQDSPIAIALDATSVYWVTYVRATGTVMKVGKNFGH